MNAVTYTYLRAGLAWHTASYHTCHTDPQKVADVLLALPLAQGSDEVRVWMGPTDVGEPHAVAWKGGAR